MDESSATDDSEEEDENGDDDEDEQGMAGALGDIIKPTLLNRPSTSPKRAKSEEPIGEY